MNEPSLDRPGVARFPAPAAATAGADAPAQAEVSSASEAGPRPSREATEAARVVPFRRPRRRRIRRLRRHPLLRLLGPLAVAAMIVAVPLAGVAWLLTSPRFALREIEVRGDERRVTDAWVERTVRPWGGSNVWRLPLGQVRDRLLANPWVADASLRKRPPQGLVVQIHERRERALLRDAEGLVYLDERGQEIAPFDPRHGVDLPLVSAATDSSRGAAIELLREIETVAPPWRRGLSEVEALSEQDFRIHSEDLPFPLLVRAGTLESKSRRLEALMPGLLGRRQTVAALDLRFARRIIVEQVDPDAPRS